MKVLWRTVSGVVHSSTLIHLVKEASSAHCTCGAQELLKGKGELFWVWFFHELFINLCWQKCFSEGDPSFMQSTLFLNWCIFVLTCEFFKLFFRLLMKSLRIKNLHCINWQKKPRLCRTMLLLIQERRISENLMIYKKSGTQWRPRFPETWNCLKTSPPNSEYLR